MVVRNFALVGGYYPFWVNESQFPPRIRSTSVWGKAMERDGVWGTLVAAAELGARARARGPRAGGGQDGTQEPPG